MSCLLYNETKCKNCGTSQSGKLSIGQRNILIVLTACFVIPGIIYFFIAKPKRCHHCGMALNGNIIKNVTYNPCECKNCKIIQGSQTFFTQKIIFTLLCMLFMIPGLIYFFVAKPKSCFICGRKMNSIPTTNSEVNYNYINSKVANSDSTIVGSNKQNEFYAEQTSDKKVSSSSKRILNKVTASVNPIVCVRGLTKKYKGRSEPAVNDITFNIYPGQFHAFIGANGAGKTTTIKSIISAYSKSKYSGEITIGGQPNGTVASNRLVGYIPEEAKFPKKMSTKNYLIKMAMLSGKSLDESKKIADKILEDTKLTKIANECPSSFSSGQKKKVLLAQSLINDPEVLIMDEPAANLDPLAREDLFNNLLELQAKGKAIFLSSHILDEVGKYASFVTILDGGKIVFDGPIDSKTDLNKLYRDNVKIGSVDSGIMK